MLRPILFLSLADVKSEKSALIPPLRLYRHQFLSTNDFKQQHFCELQLDFGLQRSVKGRKLRDHLNKTGSTRPPLPEPGLVCVKGRDSPLQCSSEKAQRLWSLEQLLAADPNLVQEDRLGLRLLRMMTNLREMQEAQQKIIKGITTFGLLQDTFVSGEIEELGKVKSEMQIRRTVARTEEAPCGRLRAQNDLFEMRLQAHLFNDFIRKDVIEAKETFAAFKIEFGRKLDEIIADSALMATGEKVSTLEDIMTIMCEYFKKLPQVTKVSLTCKNKCGVITCRHISRIRENDFDTRSPMEYWNGERRPRGVKDIEDVSAKCDSCPYEAECRWVESNVKLFVGSP